MTSIQSFGAKLLTPQAINQIPTEEKSSIISQPQLYQAPDTFERSGEEEYVPQKRRGTLFPFIGATLALAGLIFAGRKGWLSKPVQKFLGGKPKPSVLPEADITSKIKDALKPLEETGNKFGEIKIREKTAFTSRVNANGEKEFILFDRATGAPKRRVIITKTDQNGRCLEYKSYSEADILVAGLNDLGTPAKTFKKLSLRIKKALQPLEANGNEFTNITMRKNSAIASRINKNGQKEFVVFDRATGAAKRRILITKTDKNGKCLEYKTFTEGDILTPGADRNPFKTLKKDFFRRWFIGPKMKKVTIKTQGQESIIRETKLSQDESILDKVITALHDKFTNLFGSKSKKSIQP